MKRTPMRRIKPLRQRRREGADVEREIRPWAAALSAATVKPLHAGSYAGGTRAVPKGQPYRDQALRDMAENRPCLLLVPGICNHRLDTTVACHSNLGEHGKGERRKADDCFTVWGCAACHRWLDQPVGHDGPSYEQKRAAFLEGLERQRMAWRQVAQSQEPERFRRAARRALERMGA